MNVTFEMEIEFLTPTFLGGADPAEQGEFGLKALKGLVRYWWRQFQNHRNTSALFAKEKEIFGHTTKRSSFALYEVDRSQLRFNTSGRPYTVPRNSGQSYLFYSCIGRGQNQQGRKKWIVENSKVRFAVHFAQADYDFIREVLLAFWLTETFGGLGTRSRRGAGSFQIEVLDSPADMRNSVSEWFASTAKDLVRALRNHTYSDHEWFSKICLDSPIHNAMARGGCCRSFGPKSCAADVLDELGDNMRSMRACFDYDRRNSSVHRQAAALHSAGLSNNTYKGPDPIGKTAFGLPIICNFKQRDPTGTLIRDSQGRPIFENWKIALKPVFYERRASPLFISVKRDLTTGQYYANLLILWEEFLPPGEGVAIVKKQAGASDKDLGPISTPTSAALESYLRSLP